MTRTDQAFVTLATNDAYAIGALVLAESLRAVGTTRQLVVMVTHHVTQPIRSELESAYDSVVLVDVLDSGDATNLALLARPDLGLTFTKLHCWRLTQYEKCVFLDADTLVIQNVDELFDCDELAAVPDCGWPDCFNSGVFVLRPSTDTYQSLLSFALTYGSFDGGDQGLLNAYFSDWSRQGPNKRLSFVYNTVAHAFYSYAPAYKRFGQNVKIVHFVGPVKPWHVGYNTSTGEVQGQGQMQSSSADFIKRWWQLFVARLSPKFAAKMSELGGVVTEEGGMVLGGEKFYPRQQQQIDESHRQYDWERGHIDYMGMDSFENILRQLDNKITPSPSNQVADTRPVANQKPAVFPKDSEFSKNSVDSAYMKAPNIKVHRKMLKIPTKVYNQQVKQSTDGLGRPSFQSVDGLARPRLTSEPKPVETKPHAVNVAAQPTGAQIAVTKPVAPEPIAQPKPQVTAPLEPQVKPVPPVEQPKQEAVADHPSKGGKRGGKRGKK